MAKISGPLMSNSASGMIGERLTFSQRASGQQARFQRAQKVDTPSWAQADQQSLYRVAYARWLSLSDAQRLAYDNEATAKNLKMSGWNLFLRYAISNPLFYLGLVAYWTFNRPAFGTALDISKNGKVGTLKPLWPSNSPQYTAVENKKLSNALIFDGIDDYVNSGYSGLNINSNFTISYFIKTSSAGVSTCFGVYNGTGYIYAARLNSTLNCIDLRIHDGVNLIGVRYDNIKFRNGAWHNLTFVKSGNTQADLKIYFDGVDSNATALYSGTIGSCVLDKNFFIGVNNYNGTPLSFFRGQLDNVCVYNRALTPSEVLSFYIMFK